VTTSLSTREQEILRLLSEGDDKSVAKIGAKLDVSAVTVRNDLNRLAEKGFIVRTRGGGLPAFHPEILARQRCRVEAKARIAKAAVDLVEDGDHIMISAGTTTALIAKHLLGKRDVHIVTNSTLIVPYARVNPSLRVTLVGGEFRASAEALIGPIALRNIEPFHVKTAFVGADGFAPETGLTANMLEVAEIVKLMASLAQRSIVVADSSKYGKAGFTHIAPLNSMDAIITDSELPEGVDAVLEENGLSVQVV